MYICIFMFIDVYTVCENRMFLSVTCKFSPSNLICGSFSDIKFINNKKNPKNKFSFNQRERHLAEM